MKMVNRPTWREVRSTTAVVIIVVFALAGYLYVLDLIFYRLIDQMLIGHH
jgi:preprotein translocase SecE subunit